jgi:hypothetical protein
MCIKTKAGPEGGGEEGEEEKLKAEIVKWSGKRALVLAGHGRASLETRGPSGPSGRSGPFGAARRT